MSGAHTPGPWEVRPNGNDEDALIAPVSGRLVAHAAWDGGSSCHLHISNPADKPVIETAPDLLAAAVKLLACIYEANIPAPTPGAPPVSRDASRATLHAAIDQLQQAVTKAQGIEQ